METNMYVEPMNESDMAATLRHLDELERNNRKNEQFIKEKLDEIKESYEIITKEEAILAASMPGIQYGDKVTSSGDINHDELYRTLERSRRIHDEAAQEIMDEDVTICLNKRKYSRIRCLINTLPDSAQIYILGYYRTNATAAEAQKKYNLSSAQFYREAKHALVTMTRAFNDSLIKKPIFLE